MKEIIVRIKDGASTVTTKGFKGADCLKATADLEAALGKKTGSAPTSEMREQTQTHQVKQS